MILKNLLFLRISCIDDCYFHFYCLKLSCCLFSFVFTFSKNIIHVTAVKISDPLCCCGDWIWWVTECVVTPSSRCPQWAALRWLLCQRYELSQQTRMRAHLNNGSQSLLLLRLTSLSEAKHWNPHMFKEHVGLLRVWLRKWKSAT